MSELKLWSVVSFNNYLPCLFAGGELQGFAYNPTYMYYKATENLN